MTKKILTLFIGFFAFSQLISAQEDIPLANGKQYTVGEITVTGDTNYNEKTVIAFTGLRKGEKIYIPGDRISNVIKKLWDLGLFSDINLYVTSIEGDTANLELEIQEVPELREVKITGNRKKKHKSKFIKDYDLEPGSKVTENLVATTRNKIKEFYASEGYLNTNVLINTRPVKDTVEGRDKRLVDMNVRINLGEKVKISDITIEGNTVFNDAKVRRQMSTKQKSFFRFWKRSKFIEEDYEEDKKEIISEYKTEGFRDARIVSDSIIKKDNETIAINLKVEEGDKYYFGDISFLGNSVYTDRQLKQVLQISKGDTYNGTLLEKRIADQTRPDANDLTNLYQNNGYLFSQINAVETKVYNDTIDFEIRIREGKVAYFDKIVVKGNDKTNDHVIYRNLRTRPGERYSKQEVVRSVRELGQLGFFDAQKLSPEFKNVNPNDGTLDLEYTVKESGASQIELQGGYGGGGFVGTLGLSFNNFSLKGIFDKDAYKPLPMGDGQTVSIRAQAASFYQTYSLSFSEPWLGGKKPIRLTTSFSHTVQYFYDSFEREADRDRKFLITGGSVGLAKRLTVPDDYFTLSTALSFQHYNLNNYDIGLFNFPDGYANNFAITVGLTRDNTHTNPIYPVGGSKFSITAKFTPPYSVWNGVDYANLENDPAYQTNGEADLAKIDQERFKWLEYYKIKFKGDWYNKIVGDLVLRANVEYGFLGAYNNDRGVPPFERFYLGGDGLGGYSLDGRETIRLRGYPNQSLTPIDRDPTSGATRNDGATIYNKYSLELRYPITLNPSASIYGLTFAEAGASYDSFKDFNPFQLNRSAGFGVRIFMPAFGLLGIDFGYGFDPIPGTNTGPNGWETHFIIGQQF
ncbi:outer membrane protein assembly factor BamA [Mesonia aquimarina]|uniref:outer membrane protein assembly factor BamA n=1 Tax=Mesonia aquimarina TaxID=1504967 RepID=UPI000EF5F248|nr:outer membrane protein assembly factor BamA [Mesonia aquimarina]